MRKSAWLSTAAVLVVGLVLGLRTVTVSAQKADKGEKHPHMEAASKQLSQAEQEIKEGIAFDEKNPAPKAVPKK